MAKTNKQAVKLPKRIAGVKIPKALRRRGGAMVEMTRSAPGREMMAAALVAAAAAMVSKKSVRKSLAATGKGFGDAASRAIEIASTRIQAFAGDGRAGNNAEPVQVGTTRKRLKARPVSGGPAMG